MIINTGKDLSILKRYVEDNFAKKNENGNIVIEGEIQADNVPHTVSEVTLVTIPAATIQDALTNDIKNITVDAFTWDVTTIVYAYYGGKEYASFTNEDGYLEFFISNPYPMWLVRKLSQEKIYKSSFSKYGTAYKKELKEKENLLYV